MQTSRYLATSLKRQKTLLSHSVLLTPVDSIPLHLNAESVSNFVQGLYVTDRLKSKADARAAKILFAGRRRATIDTEHIYAAWAEALGASAASMRLLSGLHAHAIVFMGLGNIGDTVLILPEEAGGHFATPGLLKRLGYHVCHIPIDCTRRCVDATKTREVVERDRPEILFVDRSEGLTYEDFSTLLRDLPVYSVFDASQYLAGILTKHYRNPFEMGFDMLVSTLHKSFPGPQKALVAAKANDDRWRRVRSAMSSYVSSSHIKNTYLAGFALDRKATLATYARRMLSSVVELETCLWDLGVSVVKRSSAGAPTHHLWIRAPDQQAALTFYANLERARLLTNYRVLPYNLGYGLRLGTAAATLMGLRKQHAPELAAIINDVRLGGYSLNTRHRVRDLALSMRRTSLVPELIDDQLRSTLPG